MKPTRLSELIDALESDSPEYGNLVDRQTGSVVHLARSLISAVEERDETALEGLADWEKEQVELAKAVVENLDERFVAGPTKFDFHEYRHLERFIRTVGSSPGLVEQVLDALAGLRGKRDGGGLVEFEVEVLAGFPEEHQLPAISPAEPA
jgi:hypothetical protein